ncbi:MAG: H-X9-DG-CTERM domain-containing protein [Planctomycetota bacterium]
MPVRSFRLFGLRPCRHACSSSQWARLGRSPSRDPSPNSPLCHVCQMYAEHPGGCNVMLGDGSVRFINEMVNQLTWAALASISKREIIDGEF